jgi:hypothetical protein
MVQPSADGTSGTLIINPESLRNSEYRFSITPGSTAEVSKQKQRDELMNFIGSIAKFQNILKEDPRIKAIEWGKMFDTFESLSNIKGIGDFITLYTDEEMAQMQQQQMLMQQQQMQMQAEATASAQQQPPALSVRGNTFNDPSLGAMAQQIEQA